MQWTQEFESIAKDAGWTAPRPFEIKSDTDFRSELADAAYAVSGSTGDLERDLTNLFEELGVALVGAGLPQLPGLIADAKSYAERLFAYPEREYMAAMADLGEGPYRTPEVAEHLGKRLSYTSAPRDSLIKKGLIYSPDYGQVDFTVPKFSPFMRRRYPLGARK